MRSKIVVLERNEALSGQRRLEYAMREGYRVILIFDNLDHLKGSTDVSRVIAHARDLARNYSAVIIFALRPDTASEVIADIRSATIFPDDQIIYIHPVDFEDVVVKRVARMCQDLRDVRFDLPETDAGIRLSIGEFGDYLRRVVSFLMPDDRQGRVPVLFHLANHDVRELFGLMASVLRTHVERLDGMLRHLGLVVSPSASTRTLLPEHTIIWALMLRNGRLCFKSKSDASHLPNLYHVADPSQCYWLVRIVLRYLCDHESRYVRRAEMLQIFCSQMGIPEEELLAALDYLLEWELIHKRTERVAPNRTDALYHILPRGAVMEGYVANLFTYLEISLEDMLLPETLGLELPATHPAEKIGSRDYFRSRQEYFQQKVNDVKRTLAFLEERWNEEGALYDKSRIYAWPRYFPGLKVSFERQANAIQHSLYALSL
jgi:hypothetical protein